ncbi:MAG TPA: DUF2892 domain-containing protein [Candidatus Limnocylindrales bacterium]|nr:DUF2892 domain-containing protein [Candidatus Limnocylindrales bacterium]
MKALESGSVNIGCGERLASVALGAALLTYALFGRSRVKWGLAGTGATMMYRGFRGHCMIYEALGIDRSGGEGQPGHDREDGARPAMGTWPVRIDA